eukprot:scaffold108910_cov35-Tisochrysis_lutea.AAC.1
MRYLSDEKELEELPRATVVPGKLLFCLLQMGVGEGSVWDREEHRGREGRKGTDGSEEIHGCAGEGSVSWGGNEALQADEESHGSSTSTPFDLPLSFDVNRKL